MAQSNSNWRFHAAAALVFLTVVGVCWFSLTPAPSPPPSAVTDDPATQPIEAKSGGVLLDGDRWWFGYDRDEVGTRQFLTTLAKPTLAQAGPHLLDRIREDKPTLLYRALYEAHQKFLGRRFVVGKQGIGDCVSWGWAHGADIHLAVMWKLGDTGEWQPAATEAIYGGSRVEARGRTSGGWSDGSYGGAAAKWVRDWGILFRRPYDSVDLTLYSASRAKDWGNYGCGGRDDAGKLDALAKRHPIRNVTLVRNFREAAAAIQSGYPIPVCSGQGFSSTRDRDGFSRASGSWAHCMCFIGVRFDRPGLLCLNSWGPNWVSGPKWPEDQPDGSFWVDEATATRMLSGSDSFAISGYEGFPRKELNHADWADTSPGGVARFVALMRQNTKGDVASLSLAP